MRFRLFSFALIILNCMDYSQCQGNRWRRNKRDAVYILLSGETKAMAFEVK
ncbi:hypothetical protein STEG23_008419, partial [Scotinomys teguina]